jgi:hypothetical protein
MRSHDGRIAKLEERSGRLPRPLADLYGPEIAHILEYGSVDERDELRLRSGTRFATQ